jgi:hypothetical protein
MSGVIDKGAGAGVGVVGCSSLYLILQTASFLRWPGSLPMVVSDHFFPCATLASSALSRFFIVSRSWRGQTLRTPAGEIEWPSFLISLATRIWPKAGRSLCALDELEHIASAVLFDRQPFERIVR